MPLGSEEQSLRIQTRAKAHQWTDTGAFREGIQLDPYTRQFSRMFEIAEERYDGVVPENATNFIIEFEQKEKAYKKHGNFERVKRFDESTTSEVIAFEEMEALAERARFLRQWIEIKKQLKLGKKRK